MEEHNNSLHVQNVAADAATHGKWAKTTMSYFSDPRTLKVLWQIFSRENVPLPDYVCLADLGGASGSLGEYFSKQLREQGHSVDFTLVDLVQAHLDENTNPTTTKVCADLLEYAPSQAHDLVLLRSIFHYFSSEDQTVLAQNLYDSLAPGGYLLSQAFVPNEASSELFKKLNRHLGKKFEPPTIRQLENNLSMAGFTITQLENAPTWYCDASCVASRYSSFTDADVKTFCQTILDTSEDERVGFSAKEDLTDFRVPIPYVVHLCRKEVESVR